MEYSIQELSELAGVSSRTLRYYDEIGLLKPLHVGENNYRYYGNEELSKLQNILFYRKRGFQLKTIKNILENPNISVSDQMQSHLQALEKERQKLDHLIQTVKMTILAGEGAHKMNEKEMFSAFKENLLNENEKNYGKEIRNKYGDDAVNKSYQKLGSMTIKKWQDFQTLERDILENLELAVSNNFPVDSMEAKQIANLHQSWIQMTWGYYDVANHKALALAYDQDERFRKYYDRNVTGCARYLGEAVNYWL